MTVTHYPNGVIVETERTPAFINTFAYGFTTSDDAQTWADSYRSTYPTEGYGTYTSVRFDDRAGTFRVYATRYPSCD